ncbi:gastric triacylglycerol lipase-like [Oppia nitens]|uniref:gastric triacylglycerol lipase-like n=1 Tax=Oppia nitens TaxID=1686743 RepID=UPI0023DCDD03|nr:gastric triacylglycerol lipase-like [Oppia nitens]
MVTVLITEQRGQGLKMSSECYWDSDTDCYANETIVTDSFIFMKLLSVVLFKLLIISTFCVIEDWDPDQFRDAKQLIISRGFVAEEHKVVTPDGYILTLQHIINPYVPKRKLKKTLLLTHGILASSTDWLMNNHGLAFVLSQFGYDVWLANCRGTTYSKGHIYLDHKTDPRYWMFTLDNIALYDIPTMIKYVLKYTSRKKISYICHSQGCTVMFALLSAKSKYSKILTEFIALAPVVFDTNTYGAPLRLLSPLQFALRAAPMGLLPPIPIQLQLQGFICRDKTLRYLCGVLLGLVTGLNAQKTAYERLGAFASHFPTGVSSWVVAHFLQWSASSRFAKFDYGLQQNLIKYGQTYPPEYPLKSIRLPTISIFYSLNDAISEYRNVKMIKRYLTVPLYSENLIMDHKWGHFDYFAAKTVGYNINVKIIDLLQSTE